MVQELQKALESTQCELSDMKDRKESFERECVIYQSQLEVCTLYITCVCVCVCVWRGNGRGGRSI